MTAELPQPQPTDAVIVGGARTPFTRLLSQQADLRAVDLGAHAITHALERAGVAPEDVDMVYMGQVVQAGAGQNPARQSALAAGIPLNVPAMTINKVCLSGLTAVIDAARLIRLGEADVVVAGGQESMTNAPHLLPGARKGFKYGPATMLDAVAWDGLTDSLSHEAMGELTESGNGERNIARAEQDEVAAASHQRAARAQSEGVFEGEIAPVEIPQRKGDPVVVDKDEHIRPGTSEESLAKLRPVMGKSLDGATVTAGNASGQNDGAAAMIVTTRAKAEELGLDPYAVLRGWAVAGVAPETMGIGPVDATTKVFDRLSLTFDDIDLIELNEAFAAQALAVLDAWGISEDDPRVNPVGSGISLGHPVGATGARMVVTAAHRMRRTDAKRALVTMCIGGGQGLAAVIERA